ncbi:uncharacterized protein LOC127840327 isoform X2 [Dreissena polymorpha]|uniref:uncharacterized protein LOC127840327 isoform X2 n=1 Tax=Dreissena polymorpha TaxID=45954 RepID=UPI002265604B|nr:uncharacterized protein LOC127840327 isoform X2 [Dreissena polymorpha]
MMFKPHKVCSDLNVKQNEPVPSMETDGRTTGTIVLGNSAIKRYYALKIKPPITEPPTKLRIDRENTNIEDKDAGLVWIPELFTFDSKLQSLLTDHGRQLMLSDVAGLPIGRVPRVLASCFYSILDTGGEICTICNGDPSPSFPPWPSTQEKGGGVVIPCNYILTVTDTDKTVQMLTDTLSLIPGGNAMKIVKSF